MSGPNSKPRPMPSALNRIDLRRSLIRADEAVRRGMRNDLETILGITLAMLRRLEEDGESGQRPSLASFEAPLDHAIRSLHKHLGQMYLLRSHGIQSHRRTSQ